MYMYVYIYIYIYILYIYRKLDADEAGDPVVVAGLSTEVRVHKKTKAIHECQIL